MGDGAAQHDPGDGGGWDAGRRRWAAPLPLREGAGPPRHPDWGCLDA
eukprot:gene1984-1644_t